MRSLRRQCITPALRATTAGLTGLCGNGSHVNLTYSQLFTQVGQRTSITSADAVNDLPKAPHTSTASSSTSKRKDPARRTEQAAASAAPSGRQRRCRGDRRAAAAAEAFQSSRTAAPSSSPPQFSSSATEAAAKRPGSVRSRKGEARASDRRVCEDEAVLMEALHTVDSAARGSPVAAGGWQKKATARVAAAGKATAASTSTRQQLIALIGAKTFVAKLQDTLEGLTAPLTGWWARGPSDSTLRRMERQLELVISQDSFDAYAGLREDFQKRFECPLGPRGGGDAAAEAAVMRSEGFLVLYARLLVNYGAFCLVNSEPTGAAALLREALQMMESAGAAAAATGAASSSVDRRETSVLYVRLLLANALACEQLHWEAAEQYVEALQVLERYPYDFRDTDASSEFAQLAPGPNAFGPFSRACVREDARLFFEDVKRVHRAIAQGQARELLLQSQGAPHEQLSQLRLTMARLLRHGGSLSATASESSAAMLLESRERYEAHLDALVAREEEDSEHAMLELGRMLSSGRFPATCGTDVAAGEEGGLEGDEGLSTGQLEAGIIYLEAASEGLLEEAEAALLAPSMSHEQKQSVVRAAGVLLDSAQAYMQVEDDAAALGLFEGCLDLLNRAGMTFMTAWVLQRYADVLASVSFVDKAIIKYTAAMDVLRVNREVQAGASASGDRPVEDADVYGAVDGLGVGQWQLGPQQRLISLSGADVEASLAYCYQTYVGDVRRAVRHYEYALDAILSPEYRLSQVGRDTGASSLASGGRRRSRPTPATTKHEFAAVVSLEREHFILTNMVACCQRLQDWDGALVAQHRLLALEALTGNAPVDACMKAASLMEMKGDHTGMLSVLLYVLLIPEAELNTMTRLGAIRCFVRGCHALGNQAMGSVLLNAVLQIEGDHNPVALLDWALTAQRLDDTEKLYLNSAANINFAAGTVAATFLRAAQILVAHRVCDAADEASLVTPSSSSSPAAAAARAQTGEEVRATLEADLSALIVLSRGAFFFHQNGFSKRAEELYAAAVELLDKVTVPALSPSLPADTAEKVQEFNGELAILLANYATLKLPTDAAYAETLYERAAAVDPAPLEVAQVVADFFVQSGNYMKGAVHMGRVMAAHPESAVEMHGRVARLGCGPQWPSLSHAQRLEVLEHMVLGLGVSPSLVPSYDTAVEPTVDTNFGVRAGLLDALLMEGVATTTSDEAACLACFLIQSKFPGKSLLINRLYRVAVKRFPFHTAILVNYAKFCCDFGFHVIARKMYARAYAASGGDLCRTVCYANYLSSTFGMEQRTAGEALYRSHVEQNPDCSRAHMHYANYLAVMMPTPFRPEEYFQKGVVLDPQSKHLGLYAQFVWACTNTPMAYRDSGVRAQLFDKAEELFKRAVAVEPANPVALQNLGTFYANRRNRFEEAVENLYKAHKLAPHNVEVVRQLCVVLMQECVRLQTEEQDRYRAAAKQGPQFAGSAATTSAGVSLSAGGGGQTPRLRSLTQSTQDSFEKCLELDPTHRDTMEQYAGFAVTVLKNPTLAAQLWARINRLDRK